MAPADLATPPVTGPPIATPYKGLANFTEEDAALFFGREREREVIMANLRARRVTLLYGASGVGKTSLLRAGVVPELLALAQESVQDIGTPEFVPVVFGAWRDDPLISLIESIEKAVGRFVSAPLRLPRTAGLGEAIGVAADAADAYLLIILDQFEEYFLYHAGDVGAGTFADELPRAISQPDLQAGFLVSIRDDAVAKLDGFKAHIPGLFDTFIRVEHLDPQAARAAIVRPVEEYNTHVPPDRHVVVEPALVDAVLAQVRAGQVVLEQAGHGTVQRKNSAVRAGDRIETPYLQLVMARLWDEERQRGSLSLRLETLAALGGAQEIVRTHLDASLKNFSREEQYAVADLFHQLVTPSGTKIAHSAKDLAEYVALSEAEVTQLVEKLARPDTRIVRAIAPPPGDAGPSRYEIFHDVLAPSILDWRSRQAASRRARVVFRRRILRLVGVLGAAAIALIVWLAIAAVSARTRADRAAARARSAERQAEGVAGQLRVKSHQEALLAAKYNNQRLVETSLKGRAQRSAADAQRNATRARFLAGVATNQAARANQLAATNAAQAVREAALAVAAQQSAAAQRTSAAAARRSAAAAQLSLRITNEAAALSSISPHIVVCADVADNPGFSVAALDHVPPGATATFVGGGQTLTKRTGGRTGAVHFGAAETGCVAGVSPGPHTPSFSFGDIVTMFVVLPDLAWIYEGNMHAIHVGHGVPDQPSFRFVKQETCRTPGSQASVSQVPLVCPPLP